MRKITFGWLGLTALIGLGIVGAGTLIAARPAVPASAPAASRPAPPAAAATPVASAPASAAQMERGKVERGRYLVTAIGCADCHTTKTLGPQGQPIPVAAMMLAGHPEGGLPPAPPLPANSPWIAVASADFTAWSGPWGTSYAANLTPDVNTGLGIWTEQMFVQALRTGKHMGQSRPILPPMPWENFRHLSDQDLASIYAYLRTIPPVHNRVPEPLPPPVMEAAAR
jgi:cytochrome c553